MMRDYLWLILSGIFANDADSSWKHQRKFATTTLREFGAGKANFEGKIKAEVQTLLDELRVSWNSAKKK